jgi:hypothetical protein
MRSPQNYGGLPITDAGKPVKDIGSKVSRPGGITLFRVEG